MKKFNIKMNKKLKWSLVSIVLLGVLALISYAFIIYFGSLVVDDDKLILDETTIIETSDGEVIAEIYNENRKSVSIDEVPDHVKDAYIAIEDRRFYDHAGVDIISVMRAVYKDIIAMSKVEGASTITQQLAKNLFLYNDKTWSRKAKEVMAALYMERELSKSEILELYMNEIYFGHGVYGIEAATNLYFSKSASELSIAEGAMLVGLAKAPNGYSPINHPEKALERRNVVLSAMESTGVISTETKQIEQGKTLGLQLNETTSKPWVASYVDLVIKEAQEKQQISVDQLKKGGYRIVVAIDEDAQKIAYEKLQNEEYFPGNTAGTEGAFVMMEQDSGKIITSIGGRNYQSGDLNRVTVRRQPGSTFKPLAVYGPALMRADKYTPYTLLPDEQSANEDYAVANVDGAYSKVVSMYDGIVESKNVSAVWLLDQIGVNYSKSYLDKMGISIVDEGLAIALGGLSEGVTPIDMMEGYRTFASGGEAVESFAIEQIYDKNNELIFEAENKEEEVFSAQVAWNMTEMLSTAVDNAADSSEDFSKALAGKTGTTQHPHVDNEVKDAWFVGYTPDYVMASWMGFDHSDKEHYLTGGSSYPTRLTKDILLEMDKLSPLEESFKKPDNVEQLPKPVHLEPVTNVSGAYEFGGFSLVRAKITWDALEDDRVVYRIYQERDGIDKRVGEVVGEAEYVINNALFKHNRYYIVAYDPLTKLESLKSETIGIDS